MNLLVALMILGASSDIRKNSIFLNIGQNRSFTTSSDIHFVGQGYNFTLNNVRSHDDNNLIQRPDITQYVLQIGYFFNEHYGVSLTLDHMKFLMSKQTLSINGLVQPSASAKFAGDYHGERIHVGSTGDLLEKFEHSHGVNLVDLQITRIDDLIKTTNLKHILSATFGASVGAVVPVTEARLFGIPNQHHLRVAGMGTSLELGLLYNYLRYGLVRFELKGGFINIFKAETGNSGYVSHNWWYLEPTLLIGVLFRV